MVLGVKGVIGVECVIKAVRPDVIVRESIYRPSTKSLRSLRRNLGEQCSDSGRGGAFNRRYDEEHLL